MLLDRHLGFMQIARVAQSCRLDNKAEFVQSHHESINPSKKFIGTKISRFTEQHIGASNRLHKLSPNSQRDNTSGEKNIPTELVFDDVITEVLASMHCMLDNNHIISYEESIMQ